MKPVKTEATTVVDGEFPYHNTTDTDGTVGRVSEWEFEPDEWDIWERSRDRLIAVAVYPDGSLKVIASQLRKDV